MSWRFVPSGRLTAAFALALACAPALHGQAAETAPPAPTPVPTPAAQAAPGAKAAPQTGATQTASQTSAAPDTVHGQATSQGEVLSTKLVPSEPPVTPGPGVLVDQVIAVVNGDLVLESDVADEQRFENFEPFTTEGVNTRDKAIERLIDRDLILEQAKLQPDMAVTKQEVEAQLQTLRKDLPACKQYRCETDAGWDRFVHAQGYTQEELEQRWQQRMEVLKFIELRFRSGIDITPEQIKTYYDQVLLPAYAKASQKPPKVAVLSDRIQEILLAQQVNALLSDWLTQLKAEGSVRVIRPGEVQP